MPPPPDTNRRTCRESREVPRCLHFWQLAEVLRSEDFDERGQVRLPPPLVRCDSPPLPPPPPTPPPPRLPPVRRPLGSSRESELNILRNEFQQLEQRSEKLAELCVTQRKVIAGLVRLQGIENELE